LKTRIALISETDSAKLNSLIGRNLFGDAKKIASYRKALGKSSQLRTLLIGKQSNLPLSLPQLYMTLACCTRGVHGFVSRGKTQTEDDVAQGLYSKDAHNFSTKLLKLAEMLNHCPSMQFRGDAPVAKFIKERLSPLARFPKGKSPKDLAPPLAT